MLSSLTEAVQRAEADFCRQKHVHDWTIFADAVDVLLPAQKSSTRYRFSQRRGIHGEKRHPWLCRLTEAVQRAEADFCRQKHIHDWTIFADAVEFRSPTALARAWASQL